MHHSLVVISAVVLAFILAQVSLADDAKKDHGRNNARNCNLQGVGCWSFQECVQANDGSGICLARCPFSMRVQCFIDPCEVVSCENHPQARCVANACGGCRAEFFHANDDKRIDDCTMYPGVDEED